MTQVREPPARCFAGTGFGRRGTMVEMRPAVFVLLVVGCGRGGFEEHLRPDVGDAVADAAFDGDGVPMIDAAIDALLDAPAATPCGATVLIDDPLVDTLAAPAFTASPDTGLTLVETAGHLDIQFAASVSSGKYAFYRSATALTTDGLCASVEVSQAPAGTGSAYLKLRTAQLEVEMITSNGMIDLRTHQSGSVITRRSIPLDLVTGRFWRIHQLAGTTYWQTSPDGLAYTTQNSLPGFFTATTCQVEIGAGAQVTATNAGLARYEGVVVRGP